MARSRSRLVPAVAARASAAPIVAAWQDELRAFERTRRPYLLHPRSR